MLLPRLTFALPVAAAACIASYGRYSDIDFNTVILGFVVLILALMFLDISNGSEQGYSRRSCDYFQPAPDSTYGSHFGVGQAQSGKIGRYGVPAFILGENGEYEPIVDEAD